MTNGERAGPASDFSGITCRHASLSSKIPKGSGPAKNPRKLSETELGIRLETVAGKALLHSLPDRERLQLERVVQKEVGYAVSRR